MPLNLESCDVTTSSFVFTTLTSSKEGALKSRWFLILPSDALSQKTKSFEKNEARASGTGTLPVWECGNELEIKSSGISAKYCEFARVKQAIAVIFYTAKTFENTDKSCFAILR